MFKIQRRWWKLQLFFYNQKKTHTSQWIDQLHWSKIHGSYACIFFSDLISEALISFPTKASQIHLLMGVNPIIKQWNRTMHQSVVVKHQRFVWYLALCHILWVVKALTYVYIKGLLIDFLSRCTTYSIKQDKNNENCLINNIIVSCFNRWNMMLKARLNSVGFA